MEAKVKIKRFFEVEIAGENLGVFEEKSRWEGMVKLQSDKGVLILDCGGSPFDRIFEVFSEGGSSHGMNIIKASPSLIPQK